ncbi:hypothetical protein TNCT_121141 [Trichonephila clavata]|uniref:Lipoprotein n=1 Tax=Trichonephila clavata TaxID=2740835 RepID=A0A8X6K773_TRICU|nr:hypothetical protein TNCT_121141 [Trichonephila clavata]
MPKRLVKASLLTSLAFLLTSCTFYRLLKDSYTHLAPESFQQTAKPVYVGTVYSAQTMHDALFNDFLLIGESSFTAKHGRASKYINYGKEVGADVVIVSFQNMQKVKEHFSITERLLWDASLTTFHTKTIINFDQDVLFLKRIGNVRAPWEYAKEEFELDKKNDTDPYLGNWMGYKTCKIEIHSAGDEYLGFINEANCKEKPRINRMLAWKNGDIKLRINKQSKQGFYLNQSKIPILIKSQINKFGHLDLLDKNTDQVVASLQKS